MFSCIHFPVWPYLPKIMKKMYFILVWVDRYATDPFNRAVWHNICQCTHVRKGEIKSQRQKDREKQRQTDRQRHTHSMHTLLACVSMRWRQPKYRYLPRELGYVESCLYGQLWLWVDRYATMRLDWVESVHVKLVQHVLQMGLRSEHKRTTYYMCVLVTVLNNLHPGRQV